MPMPCQAGSPRVKPFESAACGAQVPLHRVLPSNVLTQSQEPSSQVCLRLETFEPSHCFGQRSTFLGFSRTFLCRYSLDFYFPQFFYSDEKAMKFIQLERLYHEQLLANLSAIQEQWGEYRLTWNSELKPSNNPLSRK